MDPLVILCLLIGAALVLIVTEAFLPTHGVLGGLGVMLVVCAIAVGFTISRMTGATIFVGSAIAAPLVTIFVLKAWQRSPVGKRITLNATTAPLEHEQIRVGDAGRTISALRPMGEAEFGPVTVQVAAHTGTIAEGTRVRVIAYRDGVATVEAIDEVKA